MAKPSNETPAVATFADHEVITPVNKLRRAVSTVKASDPDDDPVARAEAALARLSSEFGPWMEAECLRLDLARLAIRAKGFTRATRDALFYAAHDIKGDAATFGHPAAAGPADSLCRLIEHTPAMERIPLTLVDQHVDAIRAIIRDGDRSGSSETADALSQRLREVTDEFLARENRERPDVLDGILSPTLAPGR
jgi:chemotaxis protein histidine kinase CheA